MTDLSKHSLEKLEYFKRSNTDAIDFCQKQNEAIDAEIERRKAEPDWEAWEPKWQAFCAEASWISPTTFSKVPLIRALIAAHNTTLAGEDGIETLCDDCPPVGYPTDKTRCDPCPRRARGPKQTDEVRP